MNLQFEHMQKMNSNQWLQNTIQTIPMGGGDMLAMLGNHQIHNLQTKITHSLMKKGHEE